MSDLLSEIDEALFHDRAAEIWRKYSHLIISFILGIVLLTAVLSVYSSWESKKEQSQTGQLFSSLTGPEAGIEKLEVTAENTDGIHRSLAYLNKSHQLIENKKTQLAIKDLTKAGKISDQPQIWQGYSHLLKGYALLTLNPPETEQALKALDPLLNNQQSPWRYHALLAAALIAGEHQKNYKKALEHLAHVNAGGARVPQRLVETGRKLHHVYTIELNRADGNLKKTIKEQG